MARRSSKPAPPQVGDAKVTPEEGKIENIVVEPTAPKQIEVETPSDEPKGPAEAVNPEQIQTDIRQKLTRRTDNENVFVPANPVALEKAAALVAEEGGFELTRGTSIGARLLARAQKKV